MTGAAGPMAPGGPTGADDWSHRNDQPRQPDGSYDPNNQPASHPGQPPQGQPGYGSNDPYAQQQQGYPQQGYQQQPPQQGGQYGAPQKTNLFAVLSLAASIAGLVQVLPFIGLVAGVVFGIMARKEIAADPSQQGKAMADWGLVLGVIGLVLWVFVVLVIAIAAAIFGSLFWWV